MKWSLEVTQGHQRPTIHKFPLTFSSNNVCILHHFQDLQQLVDKR